MDTSEPNDHHPVRNIVLIGFMGCGKSTLGRILHQKIGYSHVDTDHLIEQEAGQSIPDIFSSQGEESFRDQETCLLEQMVQQQCSRQIISTGGGMVIREKNRQLLRDLGFVVWLSCSPEEIFTRTSRTRDRPLLQCDDPMAAITNLLDQRTPLYKQTAHLKINTTELEFDEITCGILESARYHYGNLK